MTDYFQLKQVRTFPRIPLEGNLDITYRCNNRCRHCWLRIPLDAEEKNDELAFDEIKQIVDEARNAGCRKWNISGGEPMLREDFTEIFDYITSKSASYSLNTNGTLITQEIAKHLKKRNGTKMVALYGATKNVHDHITRNKGSFELTLKGMTYLKEAGAFFIVQIVPMRDNFHQMDEMIRFAESMNLRWRIGASWLCLTGCGDAKRNSEIKRQRLSPKEVLTIEKPDLFDEKIKNRNEYNYYQVSDEDRLFESCIENRQDFHVDPYGKMSFCCYIKDRSLRYDLRDGNFRECWDEFIPALLEKVKGGQEYADNCGSCNIREDCRWCPGYGFLEHRNFSAKIEYLCSLSKENRYFRDHWRKNNRKYFQIAGMTIQVDCDIPISDSTFHSKFKIFETDRPGEDTMFIRHHFSLPDLEKVDLGKEMFRQLPWVIYKKGNSWIYISLSELSGESDIHQVAVLSDDHTSARIYNDGDMIFKKGGIQSLTLFPSDQILIARVLAEREGCYMHASGVIINGQGLMFAGHSDAGKSTIAGMLKDTSELLCDDRIIVRKWPEGFRIHGTWSHGDIPDVSVKSAPLKAIMFLKQTQENRIVPLNDRKEMISKILTYLIKPFETKDWWEKMLTLAQKLILEVPCYLLYFDRSGEIVNLIEDYVELKKNEQLYT